MKIKMYWLFALFITFSSTASAQWQWGLSWGASSLDRVWDLACDSQDNIYACGDFTDSLSIGNMNFEGIGLLDSYIVKLDDTGDLLWAICYGSEQEDTALSIDTDAENNVYVSGYFLGQLLIDDIAVTSNGLWDAYCAKFNSEGELLWLRTWGGSLNDIAYGLTCANNGNVYLTGWFADSFTIEGDIQLDSQGGSDVFCTAINSEGEFLWARSAGSIDVEYGYDIASDVQSNLYVLGVASPGSLFDQLVLDGSGVFVAKYNPAGQIQWLSPTEASSVLKIGVDKYNASSSGIISGRLNGTGSFGTFQYDTVGGSSDAYWASFDLQTGQWNGLNLFGSFGDDRARACENRGINAMTGSYEETVYFGSYEATSNGLMDAFLLTGDLYNPTSAIAGGVMDESPAAICILSSGAIVIGGWHFGQFRLGNSIIGSGSQTDQNAFLACYNTSVSSSDPSHAPQLSGITIYPNPFAKSVSLKLDSSPGDILVYNTRGQEIRRIKRGGSDEAYWDGLDNHNLPTAPGVYLFKCTGDSQIRRAVKLD